MSENTKKNIRNYWKAILKNIDGYPYTPILKYDIDCNIFPELTKEKEKRLKTIIKIIEDN